MWAELATVVPHTGRRDGSDRHSFAAASHIVSGAIIVLPRLSKLGLVVIHAGFSIVRSLGRLVVLNTSLARREVFRRSLELDCQISRLLRSAAKL
jgi:hypothetical protein